MNIKLYAYLYASTKEEANSFKIEKIQFLKHEIPEENIISEIGTGMSIQNGKRPKFQNLIDNTLKPGDILYISTFNCLSNNFKDLISIITSLKNKGIQIRALDMPFLDDLKSSLTEDFFYNLINYMSSNEFLCNNEKEGKINIKKERKDLKETPYLKTVVECIKEINAQYPGVKFSRAELCTKINKKLSKTLKQPISYSTLDRAKKLIQNSLQKKEKNILNISENRMVKNFEKTALMKLILLISNLQNNLVISLISNT